MVRSGGGPPVPPRYRQANGCAEHWGKGKSKAMCRKSSEIESLQKNGGGDSLQCKVCG